MELPVRSRDKDSVQSRPVHMTAPTALLLFSSANRVVIPFCCVAYYDDSKTVQSNNKQG